MGSVFTRWRLSASRNSSTLEIAWNYFHLWCNIGNVFWNLFENHMINFGPINRQHGLQWKYKTLSHPLLIIFVLWPSIVHVSGISCCVAPFWMTMSFHCAVRALSRPYITSRTQFRTGWPIPILGVWISMLVSIKSTNCLNPVDIFSKLGPLLIIVQHGLVNLANRWELHFWTFSKLYTKNCLGAKMSRMWWLKSNHFSVLQPCKILSMNFINPMK